MLHSTDRKLTAEELGVRDADVPEMKSQKKGDLGARLYIGNLPFKAVRMIYLHCSRNLLDSVDVQWTTDKSGRKKAFAHLLRFTWAKEKGR